MFDISIFGRKIIILALALVKSFVLWFIYRTRGNRTFRVYSRKHRFCGFNQFYLTFIFNFRHAKTAASVLFLIKLSCETFCHMVFIPWILLTVDLFVFYVWKIALACLVDEFLRFPYFKAFLTPTINFFAIQQVFHSLKLLIFRF